MLTASKADRRLLNRARGQLLRDSEGCGEPPARLSTDTGLPACEIMGCLVRRWAMEVTGQEAPGCPGERLADAACNRAKLS